MRCLSVLICFQRLNLKCSSCQIKIHESIANFENYKDEDPDEDVVELFYTTNSSAIKIIS